MESLMLLTLTVRNKKIKIMTKYIKIILSISLIIVTINSVNAQVDEESSRGLYQNYLESTNKESFLNTNFFLNKGFIDDDQVTALYQFIETYNEETNEIIAPVSQMDAISWTQIYDCLIESQINSDLNLPSADEFSSRLENDYSSTKNVPILFFDAKGELLEDTEITSSTKQNDYNKVHLFGAISYINKFYSRNINFELKKENYFSGFDDNESSVFIDFSDGRGIQKYNTSVGVIPVNYLDIGEKLIKVYRNAELNGTTMMIGSAFTIDIQADISDVPSSILQSTINSVTKSSKISDNIENYGGKAFSFLGNDNVFDRPVIIVQGFDPTGEITLNSQMRKYSGFSERLAREGFDMVYITLNNTNLELQSNTDVVKDLIKQINAKKQGDFESVLIGESMGGLISRMALKQFENENYDHFVGLYLSFDVPYQGANIPPGLQSLFKDVLDSRLVNGISSIIGEIDRTAVNLTNLIIAPFTGERVPNIRDVLEINTAYKALEALNSPAAKSMLVRHIDSDGYFEATQNILDKLGYPAHSRNIALINGSNQSRDLQRRISDGVILTPGERLIRFPLWRTDCNEFSLNAWSSPINARARVSQVKWKIGLKVPDIRIRWENKCIVKVFGTCVLRTKIPVKVKVGLKCATTNIINKTKDYTFNSASYDNAPGSTLPGLNSLPFEIIANTSFVPTASSIDLSENAYNQSTDPNGLRSITNRFILDDFIRNNQTPFDEVYSDEENSTHVFFNRLSDDFNTIITDEFMNENLDVQDKIIIYNRDFKANRNINIGKNVNSKVSKIYNEGNVVIEDGAVVSFTAKNEILLQKGTYFKKGSRVSLKIIDNNISDKRRENKPPEESFEIKILGAKEYDMGVPPAFKVISTDLSSKYNYKWEVIENSELTSYNDEFIVTQSMLPGFYTVKVTVTSQTSSLVKVLTKVFKINTSVKFNFDKKKNTKIFSDIQIYPNPVINETTVIAKKGIETIIIYNMTGKVVFSSEGVNKTWCSLDLKSFSSGTYIFEIRFLNNTKSLRKKVVKK